MATRLQAARIYLAAVPAFPAEGGWHVDVAMEQWRLAGGGAVTG